MMIMREYGGNEYGLHGHNVPNYLHTSWASYQIRDIAGCACAGNAGNVFPRRRLQRKPLVSDPGMHRGTCVTHVPWCMSGSLAPGGGENAPGIPGACALAIFRICQEAHRMHKNGNKTPDFLGHVWNNWQYDGTTNTDTQPQKNLTTMGKVDTSDLVLVRRWVTNMFSRSPQLGSVGQLNTCNAICCKEEEGDWEN